MYYQLRFFCFALQRFTHCLPVKMFKVVSFLVNEQIMCGQNVGYLILQCEKLDFTVSFDDFGLSRVFSWIKIFLREKKETKISSYSGILPKGRWWFRYRVILQTTLAEVSFEKTGGRKRKKKEKRIPFFCLSHFLPLHPLHCPAKLSGAGGKCPAVEALALGFYVMAGCCSQRRRSLLCFQSGFLMTCNSSTCKSCKVCEEGEPAAEEAIH